MSDLIDTTEMYLKTVYELIEEGIPPLRARIAERLGHSGPTVSQTVARLERDGLMVITTERQLELTETGMSRATRVMRKHRLAERLLTDIIGLDWPHVHEEACRWEHVMSAHVEQRLMGLLGHPQHDPYGNPIPGLDELGGAAPVEPVVLPLLGELEPGQTRDVRLERIGEPLQVDTQLLATFLQAGIAPPTPLRASREGDTVVLSADEGDRSVELPAELTKHLFVRAEL